MIDVEKLLDLIVKIVIFYGVLIGILLTTLFIKFLVEISMLRSQKKAYQNIEYESDKSIEAIELDIKLKKLELESMTRSSVRTTSSIRKRI